MKIKDDIQFDRLVQEQLEQCPPEAERIEQADPFSHPVYLILWGLILQTIQIGLFDFLVVPVLPAIGAALTYCGARSIRRVNPWFRMLYVFSAARLVVLYFGVLSYALPGNETLLAGSLPLPLLAAAILAACLQAGMLIALALGFRRLFLQYGLRGKSKLLAITVIFLCSLGFDFLLPGGWPQTIGTLVSLGFFALLISILMKMEEGMEVVGYGFQNSPVRIRTRTLTAGFLILLAASVLMACVAANHPAVREAAPLEAPGQAGLQAKELLAQQGVPQEVLLDLSGESSLLLAQALEVKVDAQSVDFGLASIKAVNATTVVFRLQGNQYYVLQHFSWRDHKPYWGDMVAIYGHENQALDLVEGRLFYEKGGQRWEAAFPELAGEPVKISDFGGALNYEIPAIIGEVAYPFGSTSPSGYVLYRTDGGDAGWLNSELEYIIFRDPFRLPPLPLKHELYARRGVAGYVQTSYPIEP